MQARAHRVACALRRAWLLQYRYSRIAMRYKLPDDHKHVDVRIVRHYFTFFDPRRRRACHVARRAQCVAPRAVLCVPCAVPDVALCAPCVVPDAAPCQSSASPWTALRAWCWSGLQPLLLPVAGSGPHSDHKLEHGRVQFTSARSCSGCASRKW